ncbi:MULTISPECIES: hypothetical protein [Burkholderia]|uniref:hypothetical protein n=1 Tax=Burkholderia TaxID=32008 RepID=UPI002F3EB770
MLGDGAYLHNRLDRMVCGPNGAPPARCSGRTLTIPRKEADGRRQLARDANLVLPMTNAD